MMGSAGVITSLLFRKDFVEFRINEVYLGSYRRQVIEHSPFLFAREEWVEKGIIEWRKRKMNIRLLLELYCIVYPPPSWQYGVSLKAMSSLSFMKEVELFDMRWGGWEAVCAMLALV